ncbi:MAG TPA: DegT/DnrJ/EryC1/StrS aminotransferase family protein [Pyrinomonadaceae bacterium]|nr:DegT/DnrJ/EryC1/StrS aminotransferase family protein [Pyrinomonadaceae bacterium]
MNFIPLMSPHITEDDIGAVTEVLRTGMLVQGQRVEALENALSEYIGVKHVVAASSGTATLHLALTALGIKENDEVIVPALSHVATANVVELIGATCVFVDVEEDTFNIDPGQIENALTPRTRAMIPVHEFGLACEISQVCAIAKDHGLHVLEDAACALGSAETGRNVGTFGDVASFSLHPRKAITSGEGGFLTTNNRELASTLRSLRNHGIEIQNGKQHFVAAGFNYRLTDFQAALVHSQLLRLDQNLERKKYLAEIYLSELNGIADIILPREPDRQRHTWQTFHVLIENDHNRDELITKLHQAGIGTNYGAQCIPAQDYYQSKYGLDAERRFPNSMRSYRSGLALPLYEKLRDEDVRYICDVLKREL